MAQEILMPTLGLTMTEGTIEVWLVAEGDVVSEGDAVATISSEKLSSDVTAPADGTIIKITAEEGDTIPVKAVMGYVGAEGEEVDASQAAPTEEAEEESATETVEETAVTQDLPERKEGERIFISPLARKMAEESGYDISKINGTGGNGRITKFDVEAYEPVAESAPVQTTAAPTVEYGEGLEGTRKVIAQRMMNSLQSTAQVTLHRKADVTELMRFKKDMKEKVHAPMDKGQLSVTTLVTKAAILALKETPEINAWYYNGEYQLVDEINIGMAVDTEDGLVVPNIKNAGVMNLSELGESIQTVAEQAREGTLPGELFSGSTFSISNVGSQQIEFFTPIINTPEIAILGVGTITKELALDENGDIEERQKLGLSLTFDHQIVDGAPAGDFLGLIVDFLEDPYQLVF